MRGESIMVVTSRYRRNPRQFLFVIPLIMVFYGFGFRGRRSGMADSNPGLIIAGIILFIAVALVCSIVSTIKKQNENKEKLMSMSLSEKYNSRPILREPATNNTNTAVPTPPTAEKIIRDANGMASPSYDPNAKFDPRVLEYNRARMRKSLHKSTTGGFVNDSRYSSHLSSAGIFDIERNSAERTDRFFNEIQQIAREKQASADVINTLNTVRNGDVPNVMSVADADNSAAYAADVSSPIYPAQEPIPERTYGAPTSASVYASTLHNEDTYSKELGQGIADEDSADDWLNY